MRQTASMRTTIPAALLLALAAAPTAHAGFPSSVETQVVPGGNSTITSPALPPKATSIKVEIKPTGDKLLDKLQVVLSGRPSPKRRLMTCVALYLKTAQQTDSYDVDYAEPLDTYAVLLLRACLEMAAEIDRASQATPRAATAAARCGMQPLQAPATFTKSGRRYSVAVEGTVKRSSSGSQLKVACKRKGKGLVLTAKPRKRGKTLRSVVGPKLLLGLYNPLAAEGSPTVKLTFKR